MTFHSHNVHVIVCSHDRHFEDLGVMFLGRTLPLEDSFIHEFTQQIILGTCLASLCAKSEGEWINKANRSLLSL